MAKQLTIHVTVDDHAGYVVRDLMEQTRRDEAVGRLMRAALELDADVTITDPADAMRAALIDSLTQPLDRADRTMDETPEDQAARRWICVHPEKAVRIACNGDPETTRKALEGEWGTLGTVAVMLGPLDRIARAEVLRAAGRARGVNMGELVDAEIVCFEGTVVASDARIPRVTIVGEPSEQAVYAPPIDAKVRITEVHD